MSLFRIIVSTKNYYYRTTLIQLLSLLCISFTVGTLVIIKAGISQIENKDKIKGLVLSPTQVKNTL